MAAFEQDDPRRPMPDPAQLQRQALLEAMGGPQDAAQRMAQFAGQRIGKVFGNAGPASQSQTPPEKVLTPELKQSVANIVGAPFGAARTPQQPVASPMQMASEPAPASAPALGQWNANFEWTPGEGGPKVSDLLARVGDPSRLTGFNTAGWGTGERGTESEKNAFGMIASRIDPSRGDAIEQVMSQPEFQQFWPDAVKVGRDQIDLDGPGPRAPVDVIRNFGAAPGGGGDAWAYQPMGETAGSVGGGGQDLAALLGGGGPGGGPTGESDILQAIMRELSALQEGAGSPMERQALMSLLGGGGGGTELI